ncbi:hypothetical protein Ahy_B03g066021 isoform B [Arachis hypogaea]|uniref:Uncharacterized protein n=1 Tax=Arachis hypogaea TaxID=3818 RepID=A0A445A2W8_ARAHY|nr:hypothetical protein Ahy_B03g066021 isoform B [Arachis hypogaea]
MALRAPPHFTSLPHAFTPIPSNCSISGASQPCTAVAPCLVVTLNLRCTELPLPQNFVTPPPGSSLSAGRDIPFQTLMCIFPPLSSSPPSSSPPSSSSSPSPVFTLSTFPVSPLEIFKPNLTPFRVACSQRRDFEPIGSHGSETLWYSHGFDIKDDEKTQIDSAATIKLENVEDIWNLRGILNTSFGT